MHLLLQRSQRDDGIVWRSVTFILDTRLELSPEEQHLFKKYRLHSSVVYDSTARIHHADIAYRRFDDATKIPLRPSFGDIATSLWNNIIGLAHGLMMAGSLRITFGKLAAGQHLESKDLEQIVLAEKKIIDAAEYLAAYFKVALTFDGGDELREL